MSPRAIRALSGCSAATLRQQWTARVGGLELLHVALQQIRIEAELAAARHYRAPAEVPLQDVQQLREGVTGPLALAFRPEVCPHLVATDAARTGAASKAISASLLRRAAAPRTCFPSSSRASPPKLFRINMVSCVIPL